MAHRYIINPDFTFTCVPLDGPIIAYGDEDYTYMYDIAIFTNGWLGGSCVSGETLEPCVAFSRINKLTAQIDENIPIEIENKALSMLPFGDGTGNIIGSNILYIGIGIGILALVYIVTRK